MANHGVHYNASQWYTTLDNQPWKRHAACGQWQDLPWTAEQSPDEYTLSVMAEICDDCPVRRRCAQYALRANNGRGADGGFYAGHWLPWATHNPGGDVRYLRSRARRFLRAAAGERRQP